jgi:hypothetical protein
MLALHGDRLLVAGSFDSIGGVAAANIAEWDGNHWHSLGDSFQGPSTSDRARKGAIVSMIRTDTSIYVAGGFLRAGGKLVSNVARWDGRQWQPVGKEIRGSVQSIMAFNGTLLATGSFSLTDTARERASQLAILRDGRWIAFPGFERASAEEIDQVIADGNVLYVTSSPHAVPTDQVRWSKIHYWDGQNWSLLSGPTPLGPLRMLKRGNQIYVITEHFAGDVVSDGFGVLTIAPAWR